MMDEYFKDYIEQGWVIIYMDDILIHADTLELLHERTKKILQRLEDNDLFIKLEKCKFNQTEVEFLGMIISHNAIKMDPIKLAGIADWPAPTNVKQIRGFLRFCNFYRKFITQFSAIACPLIKLTKKDEPWNWTNERNQAFDLLKAKFQMAPILRVPDPLLLFILETDTSKWALGAVLQQCDELGQLYPCSYLSKTFSPAERNYNIHDRELLAVIHSFEEWQHLLHGSPTPVLIQTDHHNLTYFMEKRILLPRQAHWLSFLHQFKLLIMYKKGATLITADALSR
jgi:hypothetical protein